MSSEEAAASLFGPEDTSSDPFTALGTEFNQETSDELFTGVTTANSVHSAGADFFGNLGEHPISSGETESVGHNQPVVRDYGGVPDPYAPAYNANGTPEVYGTPGANAQNNNQSYYGAVDQNNPSYDGTRYLPPAPRDPYTSPQPSTYTPSVNYQPTAPHPSGFMYPGQTSTYDTHKGSDPYAPPQPINPAPYTPYNTYAPTTSGKSNISVYEPPYAIPQATSFSAPPVPPPSQANLATVPAPPPPTTVPLARPKISNAYDPPFPVTGYSRRNVSGRVGLGPGQVASAQSAFGAYQPSTPPPPPPTTARIPPVPQAHTPPPPAAQTHAYTSAYPAPPTRTQPTWTSDANTIPVAAGTSVATTYVPSVPPLPSAPSADTVTQPQWVLSQAGNTQPGVNDAFSDNRAPPTQPGVHFFSQYDQQESQPNPYGLVTTRSQPPPPISANPNEAAQYPPNSSAPSSPQKLYKEIPASHETNPDLRHVSNSRQSPRPFSTPPPVHGLSHSPRVSPDLHRSSLVPGEELPRPRTSSPGLNGPTAARSSHAPPKSSATRLKTGSVGSVERIGSPESSLNTAHDRYAPRGTRVTNVYGAERTGSPSSFSTRSSDGRQSTKPQHASYLPPVSETSYVPAPLSQEPSPVVQDPYAPSQNNRVVKPLSTSFGYGESPYGYNGDLQPPQEVTAKPMITPYAPSPSLVGANDPLGRTSTHVPVVTFGFGGKLITCFHDASAPSTGFDVALSSRASTKVQIRSWKNLIPESVFDSATTFPGPLYGDPGPPSTGIMKATVAAQAKTKKTQVIKYLSDRSEEIAQGLGYLHNGSVEKRMAEGKLVLVKMLKIMVENDGRLLGTPQLDSAVRIALLPRLEGLVSSGDSGTNFTTTADTAGLLADSFGSLVPGGSDTTPISVTTLRATSLDKIEEFLLRGERRQAYHYALDERLWAHAMVIASSINKEAWKEVVSEFIRSELGAKVDNTFAFPGRPGGQTSPVNGREGLRVAYSLFSGQGPTAVQELVPKNLLAKANGRLPIPGPAIPVPSLGQATPRTPNFAMIPVGTKIPAESLSKWAETVAMMISSPLTNDASAALTALGDQLLANGWIEAAHVCFLLSPQTSPLGGVGNPATRIVLLGSKSPASLLTFSRDPDSIILTEILEYALANATVPKGQEPFHGVPHLQAYRLIRAFATAETGDLVIAGRYCEAITASLVRGSVHFTPTMLEQLKGLADQLSGVSHSDKPNSWMAGKISKPSLDTIGGWLEGSFTKLVTGGSDDPPLPQEENQKSDTQGFSGPFAHYNTISSTTSSARSSPQPTFVTPAYGLPARASSPMSNKASHGYGIDRSSSAMEPLRRKGSGTTLPQALSASASMASFPPIHTQWDNYNPTTNGNSPGSDLQTPKPPQHGDQGDEPNAQEVTWWGSTEYGDVGKTPTATRFEKVEDPSGGLDSDGFFSPMSNQTFSIGLKSSSGSSVQRGQQASYEDDDDLGLGNNSSKRKPQEGDNEEDEKPAAPVKAEEKKPETQQSSGGWFSRLWRRSENTSGGPVKANLGEESSFYYDKELKRWINKKAGAEAPKEALPPPPPPPRAQTASPAMMGPKPPGANGTANGNGPAVRSVSTGAVDLSASPPPNKPGMRVRSNLAPPGLDSAPPTPTGTRLTPGAPPPSRPRSQASQKKNIRNRYVDVFAQEGAGA